MGHRVVPKCPLCGTQMAPNPIVFGYNHHNINAIHPSIHPTWSYPYVVSGHHMGLATLWGGDTQWDIGVWWSPNVPSVALR